MPSIRASSAYSFHLIDYCVASNGYLLKLAQPIPTTASYRLVYIPFGQYPSLLMLEYLLHGQKELPTALQEVLVEAIKQDLGGDLGIIAIGDRPQTAEGLLLEKTSGSRIRLDTAATLEAEQGFAVGDDRAGLLDALTVSATRDVWADGELADDEWSSAQRHERRGLFEPDAASDPLTAERPIDQPLHVIRQVFLTKRLQRNLHKLQPEQLAYRVREHDLYIDCVGEAVRIFKKPSQVFREIEHSVRIYKRPLHLERQNSTAIRPRPPLLLHVHDELDAALRDGVSRLWVNRQRLTAERPELRAKPLFLLQDMEKGLRDLPRPLFVDGVEVRAVRERRRELQVETAGTADRLLARETLLLREQHQGRLKHRQYPSMVHLLDRAVREVKSPAVMMREDLRAVREIAVVASLLKERGEAQREAVRPLFVQREAPRGFRRIEHGLYVPEPHQEAVRDFTAALDVLRAYETGRRVDHVEAYVERQFEAGRRDDERKLYVPKIADAAHRDDEARLLLVRADQGERRQRHSLYVPRASLPGGRRTARELYVDRVREAQRQDQKPTDVFEDGKAPGSSSKGAYPAELPSDEWVGQVDAYDAHLGDFAGYGAIDLRNSDRVGWLDELSLVGLTDQMREGTLLSALLAAEHPDLRPAAFLDVLFANFDMLGEIMDDILVGDREFDGLSELGLDFLFGMLPTLRPATLTPDFLYGMRERLQAVVESGLLAQRDPQSGLLTFGLQAGLEAKSAEAAEDLLGVRTERPSHLDLDLLADKGQLSSHIDDEWLGDKMLRPSLVEEELLAEKSLRPSHLEGELAGDTLSRPADLEEQLVADKPLRPSHRDEELLADKPLRPSHLDEELLADKPLRPSHLDEELLADKPLRPSHLDEELLADKPLRLSHLDEELLADKPLRPSHLDEELLADKPLRPSHLDGELAGDKLSHPSELEDQLVADKPLRPALVEEELLGDDMFRPAVLKIENPLGYLEPAPSVLPDQEAAIREPRPSHREESCLNADLQDRIAAYTAGFLFGAHPKERASYLADLYYFGVHEARESRLPEEDLALLAKLALEQAIIGEQFFAHDPGYASELLRDLLAADRPEEHLSTLEDMLHGDKTLAEAVIADYLLAQKSEHNAHLEAVPILSAPELKAAFLEKIEGFGQGLLYDYQDELLTEGADPEHWTGGYGVPVDYDPHDPFNEYYPWTTDVPPLKLGVDEDWIEFNTGRSGPSGAWQRKRSEGSWHCSSEQQNVSGWFRNDFTHDDYRFTIDFKVDDFEGDGAGLVFRYIDSMNYHMFMINGGDPDRSLGMNKSMQLYRVVLGRETPLGPPMSPFHWEPGQWYTLEVTILGGRIRLSVDGILQYDVIA